MADELDDLLLCTAGETDFLKHTGSVTGTGSNEDYDEVCPIDLIFCFFFPSCFGGGLLEGVVDDIERADGVAGLKSVVFGMAGVTIRRRKREYAKLVGEVCPLLAINFLQRAFDYLIPNPIAEAADDLIVLSQQCGRQTWNKILSVIPETSIFVRAPGNENGLFSVEKHQRLVWGQK